MITKFRPYARCAQCGKELRMIPFNITNIIMCKDCYGIDRYRRITSAIVDRQAEPSAEEDSAS